jgi:hypothetical protein
MKLIKNSTELIEAEMIGFKNFKYFFDSLDSTTNNNQTAFGFSSTPSKSVATSNSTVSTELNFETYPSDIEQIICQNGITYEQMKNIIEELLNDNSYYVDNSKNLRFDSLFCFSSSFFFLFS